jgi:hypothetical protein
MLPVQIPSFEVIVRIRILLICLAASLAFATPSPAQEIRDGSALLTAMHDRYKDTWYESVVFKEKAITINPDGTTKTEIWDEVLVMPGKLRINIGPSSEGNGLIFLDNTLTRFKNGKNLGTQHFVHMLLVLGFDVYRQSAATTIDQVKAEGFDLSQIHEEKWDGQDCYVVGAANGDLKSKQFWIEKKRLLFVRLIVPDEKDPAKIHESRFKGYQQLAGAWISTRVEFDTGGKNVFNEDYFDIKANTKVDPALFALTRFNETSIFSDTKK